MKETNSEESRPVLQLIFRKKDPLYFSIEKVFQTLYPSLKKRFDLEEWLLPNFSSSLRNIWSNIRSAKKNAADLFHVTGDIHYMVLAYPRKRTILTVHDAVFLEKNKGLKKLILKWLYLKIPVARVKWVTTISQKSRDEIVRHTGCDPDKIVVIPDPTGDFIRFREKKFDDLSPVILFIGSTPNKNLERVIKALEGIPCVLEIVGTLSSIHQGLLEKSQINFRIFENLTENELADRYVNCDMVLFPSLYEGFGLPITEGQKAGRPVITSNIAPMNEVAGEAACLVNPYNVDEIRAGVRKVIEDKGYRDLLVRKGFENFLRFTPEKIAGQYIELYEKVIHSLDSASPQEFSRRPA